MQKKTIKQFAIIGAIIIAVVGVAILSSRDKVTVAGELRGMKVTVYKSPTCGCCANYISYLKNYGLEVEVVDSTDMAGIKDKYGIPSNLGSCHTTVIGDYVAEGHIPVSELAKLVSDQPDIAGIAIPDMPSGSPGMGGVKTGPFTVFSFKPGEGESIFSTL